MLRLQRKEALTGEGLRRLHRRCIEDPEQIRSLLDRARAARSELRNGVDRRSAPRLARVSWVTRDRMCLETENIDLVSARQLYFNFELDGVGYFFAIASNNSESFPVTRSARTG